MNPPSRLIDRVQIHEPSGWDQTGAELQRKVNECTRSLVKVLEMAKWPCPCCGHKTPRPDPFSSRKLTDVAKALYDTADIRSAHWSLAWFALLDSGVVEDAGHYEWRIVPC